MLPSLTLPFESAHDVTAQRSKESPARDKHSIEKTSSHFRQPFGQLKSVRASQEHRATNTPTFTRVWLDTIATDLESLCQHFSYQLPSSYLGISLFSYINHGTATASSPSTASSSRMPLKAHRDLGYVVDGRQGGSQLQRRGATRA